MPMAVRKPMGSFYANVTLRGPSQTGVLDAVRRLGLSAMVSSTKNGLTVVAEAESGEQDSAALRNVTAKLSRRLGCAALGVMNHDDDVLWFVLYDKGKSVDRYNSSPAFWNDQELSPRGGDAAALAKAFGITGAEAKIRRILRRKSGCGGEGEEYVCESDRHADLAKLLKLPVHSVGSSYSCPEGPRSVQWTEVHRD